MIFILYSNLLSSKFWFKFDLLSRDDLKIYSSKMISISKRNFSFLAKEQEFVNVIKGLLDTLEPPTVVRIAGGFVRDKVLCLKYDWNVGHRNFLNYFFNNMIDFGDRQSWYRFSSW